MPGSGTPVKQSDTPGIEVLGVNGNRILFHEPVDPAYLKSLRLECWRFLLGDAIIFIVASLISAVALMP